MSHARDRSPGGRTAVARVLAECDGRLLERLREAGAGPVVGPIARTYSALGAHGMGWYAVALAGAAAQPGRRHLWLRAGAAPLAALVTNTAVKLAVRRRRPPRRGPDRRGLPHPPAPWTPSFPSAHAAMSFAAAVALGRVWPGARAALWTAATAMALTRPVLGVHYPSDVVAGAALGIHVGRIVFPARLAGSG